MNLVYLEEIFCRLKKILRKILKILMWIVGGVIGLFLLIVLLIQIPAIQNVIKNKAVGFIENKINTPVSIDKLEIGLPKKIILKGFYFEDQQQDTLAAGKKLSLNISLYKLLSNDLEINSVDLQGAVTKISRDKDSVFNYQYILDAFSTPTDTTSSKAMKISVHSINLNKIRVYYKDAVTKNDLQFRLNHFDTDITEFNLDSLNFTIPRINLDGLYVTLDQGKLEKTVKEVNTHIQQKTDQGIAFNVNLQEIDLSNIGLNFVSKQSNMSSSAGLQELHLKINSINIPRQTANIESLSISGLKGNLALFKLQQTANVSSDTTTTMSSMNWKVKMNNVDINKLAFEYHDNSAKETPQGLDYSNLDLNHVNLEAKNFYYSNDTISGNIKSFNLKEKLSGLEIDSLTTNFLYASTSFYLKNLYLKTPDSRVQDKVVLDYPSLNALQNQPEKVNVEASLQNSSIAFQDILLFAPQLRNTNPFKSHPNAILRIDGALSGKLNDLQINNLIVSGLGNSRLALSGSIKGLPDVANAYYNLDIQNLHSTAGDIHDFIPAGTIPSNITLPQSFSLHGNFSGTSQTFNTDLSLNSSLGNARIKGNVNLKKGGEKYDAQVSLDNFNLGKLIQNDSIGKLTLNATVKGTGLDPKTANATASGHVVKATYNSYTYNDINFEGNIQDGQYHATAGLNDSNLNFDLEASGNLNARHPSLQFTANLNQVSLDSLHLRSSPLQFHGKVKADLQTADPDYLNGKITLTNFTVTDGKQTYPLDTISITSKATADSTFIRLNSQFLNATVKGKYQLTKIGSSLSKTISHYFSYPPVPETQDTLAPQNFEYQITVNNDPVLQELVPTLTVERDVSLHGKFNSKNDSLTVIGDFPALKYTGYKITNAHLDVHPEGDALSYSLNVDDISGGKIKIPNTDLTGKIHDNQISYDLEIDDLQNKPRYEIAGVLKSNPDNLAISLDRKNLLLNYKSWNVPSSNSINIADEGVWIKDLSLSNGSNVIRINSPGNSPKAPVDIDFENFDLETVSAMVSKDTLLAGGKMNGEIVIHNLTSKVEFTSDLLIENFNFKKDTIGDIKIEVNNYTSNQLAAKVNITGQDNEVSLSGTYNMTNGGLDMDLDMQKLHIKSIQGFSFGSISEGQGYLSGNLKIVGTASEPRILGGMNFNDVGFRVSMLNAYFQNINDKLNFNENGLQFDKFTVYDSEKNKLIVNGRINTTDYSNFGFGLSIDANNFKAMNSTAADNDLYYGDLFLDTHLTVKGSLANPVVNGNLAVNKGTDLTIVLPQSDPSIADREGVVEFIDEKSRREAQIKQMQEQMNSSNLQGMDISVNITVDPEAKLTMIIDSGNGDYIDLKGKADLNAGIDPSGKTSITGRYEIEDGSYNMSFNFIHRKFDIEKGSYILFLGSPTDAKVDLTAVYDVKASPLDLLDNQLGNISKSQRNTYKQQIPFEAVVEMTGQLLEPDFSFDIRLPEGNYNVSSQILDNSRAKLAQLRQEPSALNKQVFALLLLNRFIGENPFSSAAGGVSTGTLARQSVSKILSEQLNNLASDLINGVDLNFDLQSIDDYTTGQRQTRTDLNVGVSKSLLNDRLKVTIGSSFGLEGPSGTNRQATNIAGDVSVDYQLSKDGRYVLRVYRINQYEVALQGQVIETGVAFIITLDYDKFIEIFNKNK